MKKLILLALVLLVIPFVAGANVNETSINEMLSGYYRFEYNWSNGNCINDSSVYRLNGACTNNSYPPSDVTGKLGMGVSFDGTDDNIIIPNEPQYFTGTTRGSFCFWMKIDNKPGWSSVIGTWRGSSNDRMYHIRQDATSIQAFIADNGVSESNTASEGISTSLFDFVCWTYDGSNTKLWKNAVNTDTVAVSGYTIKDVGYIVIGSTELPSHTPRYSSYDLDELMFFNQTINQSLISYLYNEGNGLIINVTTEVPVGETKTLNLSAALPLTDTQLNVSDVTFNLTANSSTAFNCSLYINSTLNETKYFPLGADIYVNYTKSLLADNTYSWYVECKNLNNSENTTAATLYIDTTIPQITDITLSGNNTSWGTTQNLYINITETNPYSIDIANSCGYTYSNSSISSPYQFYQNISLTACSLGTQTTNVTVCDGFTSALSCIEQTYSWTALSTLNITAKDFNNNAISNFSIYVNGSLTASTTIGYLELELAQTDYNLSFESAGYASTNTNITISTAYQTYEFIVYTRNSINLTFRDEETEALVNVVNLEVISDSFANNYSTVNGTLYVDLLSPDFYTFRYSASGYGEKFYFLNLVNNSHSSLTLYLLSNDTAETVTATVYDTFGNELEDVYIKILKYDLATNNYILRETVKTDFEGKANFLAELNSEYYQFILEFPYGTIRQTTSPAYLTSTDITFYISITEDVAEEFYDLMDISYALVFNNVTQNFRLTYSDPNSQINQMCVFLYKSDNGGDQSLFDQSCNPSNSGVILINAPNVTSRTYTAKAFAYFESGPRYLVELSHTYGDDAPTGKEGLWWVFVFSVVVIFIARWSKAVALFLAPLPSILFSVIGILPKDYYGYAIGMSLVTWIVAFAISRK